MIIKQEQAQSKERVKLIPKNQNGNVLKKMADVKPTVTVPQYVAEVDAENRVYTPGSQFKGVMTSTPKRTDSVRGDLLTVIKNRMVSTKNPKSKKDLEMFLDLVTKAPGIKGRGWEELDYYASLNPELDKIVNDPLTLGHLKKRGFDIPPKSTNPSGLYTPPKEETAQAFKEGGQIKLQKKKEGGKWIQKATKSIKERGTEGKCTPITKPGCTGKAKVLAKTFKKMAKERKED